MEVLVALNVRGYHSHSHNVSVSTVALMLSTRILRVHSEDGRQLDLMVHYALYLRTSAGRLSAVSTGPIGTGLYEG